MTENSFYKIIGGGGLKDELVLEQWLHLHACQKGLEDRRFKQIYQHAVKHYTPAGRLCVCVSRWWIE